MIFQLIFEGKSSPDDLNRINVGENVVKMLVEPYYKSKRIVCADNFFSSIHLAESLRENGLFYVGTLRKNKKRSE